MTAPEVALSITDPRRLAALDALADTSPTALAEWLGDETPRSLLPTDARLTHLYFGSEYCEHLFPEDSALDAATRVAERLGLRLVLTTPIANDALLARLRVAMAHLPGDAEAVVNDWGAATLLRREFPHHRILAGRQLAKMIKDPRLPNPQWQKVYPSNYGASPFARFMERLGIAAVELDVPPFATPEVFEVGSLAVSVWAPFAYIAKGRICKVGSLARPAEDKFAPGRPCHHECLGILEAEPEHGARNGLRTFSRGTTMFYRHDASMGAAVREALNRGLIARVVCAEV